MPAKKELSPDRRKQVLKARGDLLRQECGEIWGALGRRIVPAVNRLPILRSIPPPVFSAFVAAIRLVRQQLAPRHRAVGSVLSVAGIALETLRPESQSRRAATPARDPRDLPR
jgi:hypothetical protein